MKKISGFAKGYGFSAEQQLTTRHETNHAWNAVFLKGNWFLLDSTWGAGHLDTSNQYKATFEEYYFLPNPQQFVYSHFPYMDNDMMESMKWQLLKNPLSLEKFNHLMRILPDAFRIGVTPKSHLQSVIKFEDEIELSFKQEKKTDNAFLTTFYKKKGNMLSEIKFSTHMYIRDGRLNIKVKPPETGKYRLQVFGDKRTANATDSMPQLFEYVLHCEVPVNKSNMRTFPFPSAYPQAFIDECHVLEPLGRQLPPKTEIKMRFRSPYLKQMMVDDTMLKRDGQVFEGTIVTPEKHYLIDVYGSRSDSLTFSGQYQFCVG